MGWTHILVDVGKGLLKAAPIVTNFLPGPIGFVVNLGTEIANAELSGKPGPEKKTDVITAVVPADGHNVTIGDKLTIVSQMVEHVVQFLNLLGQLYPATKNTEVAKP